jgi:PilZ domain
MGDPDEMQRQFERRAPAHAVQIAAEAEAGYRTSGQALNLSDGGACVALQTADLSVGDELILWLNFARPPHPVTATARVVWTGRSWGRPRYGIEWTHHGPQRRWIGWLVRV